MPFPIVPDLDLVSTMLLLCLGGVCALVGLFVECAWSRSGHAPPDPMRGLRILGLSLCAALLLGLALGCLLTLTV